MLPLPPEEILLVEDHDGIREVLSCTLQMNGFKVQEARDGREALDLLLAGARPAYVVTDFNMPRMDGGQLIREIVRLELDVKGVFVFTAIPATDERIRLLRADVGKLLPFSFVSKGEADVVSALTERIRFLS